MLRKHYFEGAVSGRCHLRQYTGSRYLQRCTCCSLDDPWDKRGQRKKGAYRTRPFLRSDSARGQQDPLHLQVVAAFLVTLLIFIPSPPFRVPSHRHALFLFYHGRRSCQRVMPVLSIRDLRPGASSLSSPRWHILSPLFRSPTSLRLRTACGLRGRQAHR